MTAESLHRLVESPKGSGSLVVYPQRLPVRPRDARQGRRFAQRNGPRVGACVSGAPRPSGYGHVPVTVQGAEPEVRALNELRELGVTRATLYAPFADADHVFRFLDDVTPLVDATHAT